MKTRQRHTPDYATVKTLENCRNGGTLRKLATDLGYPENYAATLSAVLRAKPGALTLEAENVLRVRLGLPPIQVYQAAACPDCGRFHPPGRCHGKPVAAVVCLAPGERVTRPKQPPARAKRRNISISVGTWAQLDQARRQSGLSWDVFLVRNLSGESQDEGTT